MGRVTRERTLLGRPGLRRVIAVVPPGAEAGDAFGPLEVLRLANEHGGMAGAAAGTPYDFEAVSGGPEVRLGEIAGIRLETARRYGDVRGPIDTLLLMPVSAETIGSPDPALLRWIRRTAGRTRRVVGLCSGAFLLGHAGLLEGHAATTHWELARRFRALFPDVRLDADRIFVRDRNVWTSAGANAAMDLMLALVEEDLGPAVAREVARRLVLFLQRPGGQSQFSTQLSTQFAERSPLRELQGWIFDHLDQELTVDALAEQVGMSARNFRRVFLAEVGVTPGKFVARARLEAARRLLEDTRQGTEAIAAVCGFGSAEHMRVAFVRELGVSPASYRGRFASTRRTAA